MGDGDGVKYWPPLPADDDSTFEELLLHSSNEAPGSANNNNDNRQTHEIAQKRHRSVAKQQT